MNRVALRSLGGLCCAFATVALVAAQNCPQCAHEGATQAHGAAHGELNGDLRAPGAEPLFTIVSSSAQDSDSLSPTAGNKFPLTELGGSRASMPVVSGSLAVRAVQGTDGGPLVAGVGVEIELYHRGTLIDVVHTELDEFGVVIVEDLPISMGIQPVVMISYESVTYQKVGAVMDPANPRQSLEIQCFELTDVEPAWRVRMRHVMVAAVPEGVQITEVMAIENPTDRTWTGSMRNGAVRAVTTEFTLPRGAVAVSLGRGFHDWCCTTLEDGRLMNHLPLMPQTTEMIYSYVIPSRRGAATLDIIAPAQVDHLMVLVPAAIESVATDGLESTGMDMMGDTPVQLYMAGGMSAAQQVSVSLTGLGGQSGASAAGFAKTAAIVGGVVILLIALWILFARPKNSVRGDSIASGQPQMPSSGC